MTKRFVLLLAALSVLASVITFASASQRNAQRRSSTSAKSTPSRTARRAGQIKSPTPPPTSIGFLSAPRTVTGGAIAGIFPAAMGDFAGNGRKDAVTIVNTGSPAYNIAAAMNDGAGNFTTVLTPLPGEVHQDPVFVADLNGDGKDDVLVVSPASSGGTTTIQAWLSNGDGTFTATSQGTVPVTVKGFVWASIADVNGDGCPDVVLADAATPSGNIWTVLGKGDGTCDGSFQTPTFVAFAGALNPGPLSQGVPGNPVVFADFNGDRILDFAAAAAGTNQITVYLNISGVYTPTLLTTSNGTYSSCFLGGGDLNGDGRDELVSANCLDGNITVYVNNGSGTFAPGVYYPASSPTAVILPNPVAITIADVNGDSKNDILATDLNSAAVWILTGNGDGTVNEPTVGYATGGAPQNPALVADFNGDGKADVFIPDSQLNFMFLAGYGDGTFRSATNYYAENVQGHRNGFHAEGVGLASGDFNGDGIPDFVIGTGNGNLDTTGITVFLSNADGSLQTGINYFPAPNKFSLQYVAVADFNGDGIPDIAASDNFNGVVQIFYGVGDGTFTTGPTYTADSKGTNLNPVGIVTADFNGDGKPDLAVINNNSATVPTTANVGVLINNGNGGFNPVVNYPLSTVATELTAADLNGDGSLDLVVPLYGACASGHCSPPDSAVAIFLNKADGTGTLLPQADFQLVNGPNTYFNPYDAAVADLNGDGKVDLVLTIQDTNTINQGIAVALGNGDGTFQPPRLLTSSAQTPPLPGYVKIADMNRDGHPDLVYTNALSGTVGVMYGVGDGTFYDPLEFAASRWAWDFALVDVNGDGVLDVVNSGFEQSFDGVGVLLNSSGDTVPVPASSANPAVAGAPVTLTTTVAGSKVRGVTTVPTGSVTFFDGSTSLGAPAALNASGQASLTKALAIGSHSITAHYSGDPNYVPVTSAALVQVVKAVPDYTLSANPGSQTVNRGSPATYQITVTPSNSYNGTISFPSSACSGLPAGTTCSFSPSSLPGSGSTTLTISTSALRAALVAPEDLNPQRGKSALLASLTGFGLIGIVLAGDLRKHSRRRASMLLGVLAMALILCIVGCGGGGSTPSTGGGGGTPAGTYTIQVNVAGTAGTNGGSTAQHSLSPALTLVVQ